MKQVPIVTFGSALKALGNGKVGGHLVLFGSNEEPDLAGEWFTKETDFETEFPAKCTPRYQHDLDPATRGHKFAKADITLDGELGIWFEAQLNLADEYEAAVYKLAELEKLGLSSGTASHLIDIADDGEIKRWPLGLDGSFTPTPCDPRQRKSGNEVRPIKGGVVALEELRVLTFEQLKGGKSTGMSWSDQTTILEKAIDEKLEEDYPDQWKYGWIVDVFDESDPKTLVFRMDGTYWEAPYTFDGTRAEIGDAVESVRYTGYKPVDAPTPNDFSGMKAADHGKAVLGATKAYFDRIADIRAKRAAKGQDVSPETLAQLKQLRDDVTAFLDAGNDDAAKAEFERAAGAAMAMADLLDVDRMLASL